MYIYIYEVCIYLSSLGISLTLNGIPHCFCSYTCWICFVCARTPTVSVVYIYIHDDAIIVVDDPDHDFHNPGLKKCISRAPRLVGCEALYYFPKDVDLCPAPDSADSAESAPPALASSSAGDGDGQDGAGPHIIEMSDVMVPYSSKSGEEEKAEQFDEEEDGPVAGNLVVHVRSGDIFEDDVLSYYGQVYRCFCFAADVCCTALE